MSDILFKQFEQVRSWTIEVIKSIPEDIVHITPRGFSNNILWQIGHILSSTEYFLFELPEKNNHLPDNYVELFGTGTSPEQWKQRVPTVAQLITDLERQSDHIKQMSNNQMNQTIAKPKHGFQTVEDCASFSVLHEALHIGKIEEMKRILTCLE
ncbi:DinB family protein [Sediminibacillus albus]|uniref:DinB superfamily protein n=1 Tax=Sediminibacillus albus TaxID=407036 RepID=A0A1G9C4G4_9BACI|nr:DinB family protein [Sediminibacillus albus]SDK46567.1 DinB superfamily protein [Sediminibacillus albus]